MNIGFTISGTPVQPVQPAPPTRKTYARVGGKLAQWDVPAKAFKEAIHTVQREVFESTGKNAMALVLAVDNTQTH